MDFEQAIRILKEAQGDPARLGLASVDLLLAGHPDEEREKVRTALEVAAVPHWFDEKILAALLDSPLAADVEALAARLRRLPVVEPFPARGPGAANVHEDTRLALRARMKAESPERLRALSTGARACFAGDSAPHTRIEALYHRFTAEPEAAARECGALADEWDGAGRYEALLSLGIVLDELLQEGLPEGLVRGMVLYRLADIRYHYQPLEITAAQARAALEEYQRSGDNWRIAMSQELLGNVLLAQGDLPHALDAYRASLDTRKRLAQADPGDTTAQRNVSVSHNKVGDVLGAHGDLAGALAAFRAGLAIAERLAEQDLAYAGWQRDLSVSHNKVGEVLREQGDLAGALAEYRAGLAIAERFAAQDPAHAGWQRDLSIFHEKVGEVLRDQGDLAGALAAFRASFTIRECLAAQDPAHAGWQRDLSVSHNKVGEVLRDRGDLAGALAEYRADLAIAERLAAQDPAHAGWQRDLSVSHNKVGDILRDHGDLAGALAEYRASLAITERLAAQDLANAQWQTDLAISCGRVAKALLALPEGDRAETRRLVARGLERMEALAQAHPSTPHGQQVRAWLEALRKQAG